MLCKLHKGSSAVASWAVGHLGPPPVRLWLQANNERVLVQVWDGSDRMPQATQSELLIESGRGLALVEALSTRVGVYVPQGSSGKVVWAEVER